MKQEQITYEEAMAKLDTLAGQMERGEVSLDEMGKRLHEAQQLLAYCKELLYEAEKNCSSLLQVDEKV